MKLTTTLTGSDKLMKLAGLMMYILIPDKINMRTAANVRKIFGASHLPRQWATGSLRETPMTTLSEFFAEYSHELGAAIQAQIDTLTP